MTGHDDLAAEILHFKACLTELDSRLGQAGSFSGPVPASALIRMDLALAILVDEAPADLVSVLTDLRETLQQIHHTLTSVPERCDPQLNPAWDHGADFLENLLERLNQGETVALLAGDPGWRQVAGYLTRAQGPLGVLDRMNEAMAMWVARYGQGALEPTDERELGLRWRKLRAEGDSLFLKGLLETFKPGGGKIDRR